MRTNPIYTTMLAACFLVRMSTAARADESDAMIAQYHGCTYIECVSPDGRYLVSEGDARGIILSLPQLKPMSPFLVHGELPKYGEAER